MAAVSGSQDQGIGPLVPQAVTPGVRWLRVFPGESGIADRSILEIGGTAIVVSQFTLYADVRKGRRPSWDAAARPEVAAPRVEEFCVALEAEGVPVRRGVFGADMRVAFVNDGPFTLLLDAADLRRPRSSSALPGSPGSSGEAEPAV